VHLTGCSSTLLSPLLGQGHAAKSTGISLVVPMSTQLSGAQKCTNRRRNYIKMDFFKKKKNENPSLCRVFLIRDAEIIFI